MLQTELTVQLI